MSTHCEKCGIAKWTPTLLNKISRENDIISGQNKIMRETLEEIAKTDITSEVGINFLVSWRNVTKSAVQWALKHCDGSETTTSEETK